MKCPSCGKWNRESLPACFYCGAALNTEDAGKEKAWQQEIERSAGVPKAHIQIDEQGNKTASEDSRDTLAQEMRDLQKRKAQGEAVQAELRIAGIEQGYDGSNRNTQTPEGRLNPFVDNLPEKTEKANQDERPARRVEIERKVDYDDYGEMLKQEAYEYNAQRLTRTGKVRRTRLMRKIAVIMILLAVAVVGIYFLWTGVLQNLFHSAKKNTIGDVVIGNSIDEDEKDITNTVYINASVLDDMRAHTIMIPAEEGSSIWIPELLQNYEVVGGYAVIEVADYTWYADEAGVTAETVNVTLNPYISTKAGEKRRMGVIQFEVDVPAAELLMITPDVLYTEVTSGRINIKFRVDENATVTVNGENYTSFINANENGLVDFYTDIQPIGINTFEIVANCQYYRENRVTLTVYRAPVSIDVHLDSTLSDRSINKKMTIRGSTVAGANIIVLTPYENMDLSNMASKGEFSFDAVFETIGNNEIQIEVSMNGVEPTIYTKTVYYLPPATDYSKMAWSMNKDYDYSDYLNLTELRVSKTQVYVCKGTFT